MSSHSNNHTRTLKARQAPRCRHIKANGEPCRAAANRGQDLCYFHQNASTADKPERLPVLEDANAIQVALMIVMDGLYRYHIPHKTAALLLYGLQIAAANLRHLQLAPTADADDVSLATGDRRLPTRAPGVTEVIPGEVGAP